MQIAYMPIKPKEEEIRIASLINWQSLKIKKGKEGRQAYCQWLGNISDDKWKQRRNKPCQHSESDLVIKPLRFNGITQSHMIDCKYCKDILYWWFKHRLNLNFKTQSTNEHEHQFRRVPESPPKR